MDTLNNKTPNNTRILFLFYNLKLLDYQFYAAWTMLIRRWLWCWWHHYLGDLMMVAILRCWWLICYVGDMEFYFVPNSIIFFPSLNRSRGIYIGQQYHNTPECDIGDWYSILVPNAWCWWRDLSLTSKSCQHIWSTTSVTNIDVTPPEVERWPGKLLFKMDGSDTGRTVLDYWFEVGVREKRKFNRRPLVIRVQLFFFTTKMFYDRWHNYHSDISCNDGINPNLENIFHLIF